MSLADRKGQLETVEVLLKWSLPCGSDVGVGSGPQNLKHEDEERSARRFKKQLGKGRDRQFLADIYVNGYNNLH